MPASDVFTPTPTAPAPAAPRVRAGVADNPNHHLWRNGRLWWVAFTVLHDGWRQERVRRSLGTADLPEARARRDALLAAYARRPHVSVTSLGGER